MNWRCLFVGLLAAVFFTGAGGRAWAHDETVSTSSVEVLPDRIVWKVDVGVTGLAKVLTLPAPEGQLDEAGLATLAPAVGRYLGSGLELRVGGRVLGAELGRLEPRYEPQAGTGLPYLARVEQTLVFPSAIPFDEVTAKVGFFKTLTANHRALITVTWGGERRQFTRLGAAELGWQRGQLGPSTFATVREFVAWGGAHIFLGYDHIAFLLALLLAITSLRELVKVVTAFTVAHSATLLLSALDVVAVPSRLTEVLIAASIAYVAIENLVWVQRRPPGRWLLTFAFGLVHGLGFATELRTRLAEMGGQVALPVISFNVGVEIGQLAIVAVVYPLFRLVRLGPDGHTRQGRQASLLRVGSVPILLVSLYWLIDRLGG